MTELNVRMDKTECLTTKLNLGAEVFEAIIP